MLVAVVVAQVINKLLATQTVVLVVAVLVVTVVVLIVLEIVMQEVVLQTPEAEAVELVVLLEALIRLNKMAAMPVLAL
jgi:hypothetical protein